MNQTGTGPEPPMNRSKSGSGSVHMNLNRRTADFGPEPESARPEVRSNLGVFLYHQASGRRFFSKKISITFDDWINTTKR